MTDILRFRQRDTSIPFTQLMGNTFYINKRNGYEMPGTPVQAFFAPGVVEKCFDINHGVSKTPYKVGGPFFLVRVTEPTGVCGSGRIFPYQSLSQAPAGYPLKGMTGDLWQVGYEGKFIHTNLPNLVQIPNKDISSPTDYRTTVNPNDLSSLGARGYARLRPKVEVAGLGQAIAEARDVPETLHTTAGGLKDLYLSLGGKSKGVISSLPKKASDQFINHQFGWLPFLKDLRDMYDLIAKYEYHLDKAERQNDKWYRRRFSEEAITSETVVYNTTRLSNSPLFTTYLNPALGSNTCSQVTLQVRRQTMTRIWYEGEFKRYDVEFDKRVPMHENIRAGLGFLSLAGAKINPVLIWKITPWSWAADWLVNVGDNIQLAQDLATDQVVSKYMYLMRESYDRYEYVSTHVYPNTTITCTSYQEVSVKRRVAADSPFGFSMSPGGLSGIQLAILAALGISKVG